MTAMKYPADFPPESRAAVAAEKLQAERDFDKICENPPRMDHGLAQYLQAELRKYILRQLSVFVREACKLGHKGIWHVDRIEEAGLEFLRLATIDAQYDKGYGVIGRSWTDNWGGQIEPEVMRQFQRSDQFREFKDELLEVAKGQERAAPNQVALCPAEHPSILEPELRVATDSRGDRPKVVDDFLALCNRALGPGRKVTRKSIWLLAGHKQARQFEYWQQSSEKATAEDDRSFRRILGMPPAEFIELLNKKGPFRSKS